MRHERALVFLAVIALLLSCGAFGFSARTALEREPAPGIDGEETASGAVTEEARDRGAGTRAPRDAMQEESATVATVARSQDAVVSVIITKDLPILERSFDKGGFEFFFPGFGDDPFPNPFGFSPPTYRQRGTEKREVGGGTAFFVRTDGLLLTNRHVVADEDAEYTVLLNDGTKLAATVATRDPGNDIALLKVNGAGFTALPLAEDGPALGLTQIANGNTLGEFRNTVSRGVISGLKRSISAGSSLGGGTEHLESIIQTDAAINNGNSGGPLLDLAGRVVGMNTAVAAGAQNIGFAIPASDLWRAIESYERHGRIVKTYLGIRYTPITEELREQNDIAEEYGVLIMRGETPDEPAVLPGSPAQEAGLREGDIIRAIDGTKLDVGISLAREIQQHAPGDTVRLTILRAGEEHTIDATLGEQQ